MSRTRRRLAAGAFLVVAGPVALGSVAYACQTLATLHANPRSAAAGSTVSLFGKNYNSNATSTNIVIHLDTRDGAVIASFPPASVLTGTAVIPVGTAGGTHTLVATQYTAAGNAVSGTPGRATVVVTVAARSAADGVAAGPAATASTDTVAAATPAAVTPVAPAASGAAAAVSAAPGQAVAGAPSVSSTGGPAAPAAGVASLTPAGSVAGGAAVVAPAVSGPDGGVAAVAAPSVPVAGPASVNVGLLPASAQSSSILPGLTLVAGMALVLLGLVAFLKSGRSILGRSFNPLAG